MEITINIPDDLLKSLKSDLEAQATAEKFLGFSQSASTKVYQLIIQASEEQIKDTSHVCDFSDGLYCKCGKSLF